MAEPIESPVELCTANGKTQVDLEVPMQDARLLMEVHPLALAESPAVLSVGSRSVEDGCSFRWPAGETRYLVSPAGQRHNLVVGSLVPYLPHPRGGRPS